MRRISGKHMFPSHVKFQLRQIMGARARHGKKTRAAGFTISFQHLKDPPPSHRPALNSRKRASSRQRQARPTARLYARVTFIHTIDAPFACCARWRAGIGRSATATASYIGRHIPTTQLQHHVNVMTGTSVQTTIAAQRPRYFRLRCRPVGSIDDRSSGARFPIQYSAQQSSPSAVGR